MLFFSKKEIPFKEIIPDGYVDIHSHLIAGVDDGVQTIYQSAYILEQFNAMGIKKIITTPHVLEGVWPNTSEIIKTKLTEMQHAMKSFDLSNIKLHASAEYMLDELFYTRLKSKDILTLYKNYILVEMSTFSPPANLVEILFEIKLAGYIPILAHPERYAFYEGNLKKYDQLKEAGFLFQLNLLSLKGYYGDYVKSTAIKLLSNGYIDFTGSDIHNYQQLELLQKGFSSKLNKKLIPILQKNIIFS